MRYLAAAAALLLCIPARCQQSPNTLTPQEIAAGWILLFDGESGYGLAVESHSPASVPVGEGEIRLTGGTVYTTTEFGDFELTAECWTDRPDGAGIGVRRDPEEASALQASTKMPLISLYAPARFRPNQWVAIRLRKQRGTMTLEIGRTRARCKIPVLFGRAQVSLAALHGGQARFRSVKLRPVGLESIFNGRDLTGWEVVPDHKSVFTVTPEGCLNVKNGNGDIQSTREWGDFTLQIEVYSNGDHLNSGVFFRANRGKFWSGYEDQIRNQWQGDDRNRAVDYGTGGIYNRLPARRVVSSDREWFTMTLVAHGLHLASWVNGYLTADFTDRRPENQANARAGARTAPGVISLQGHDPTTDLSFRNIRIRELPR